MLDKTLFLLKKYVIPAPLLRLIRPFYHFFLAFLANVFYSFPSRKITVVGVTGTKGKTTTLELMNIIFETANKKTGLLSSTRKKVGSIDSKSPYVNTMPGRFAIQRFLREAVDAKCDIALIEVTSEGVTKSRHRFINWDAAVFLNLTAEHVEAHGSFERYRDAKLSFFRYLKHSKKNKKYFVINGDDAHASYFEEAAKDIEAGKIMIFHRDDVFRVIELLKEEGTPDWLLADFNIENVAASAALVKIFGIQDEIVIESLKKFKGLAGRMDFVQKEPFAVVIDYAHTPGSLRAVYETIRKPPIFKKSSRLICVLGSAGGGRDKWKRPELGAIAGHYCDEIFLTSEDPYDENPEEIIAQIYSGIPNSNYPPIKVYRVFDRREAIEKAIYTAQPGDAVVVTGMGSQEWFYGSKGQKIPWNERKTAEDILNRK